MKKTILLISCLLASAAHAAFDHHDLSTEEAETVKAAITKRLKDPDSAKFGALAAVKYRDGIIVCGTVNAKNSYGGYSGASPFVGEFVGAMFQLQKFGDNSSEMYHVLARCQNAGALPPDL